MRLIILILSWIVLITANQESPYNFKSRFDGDEAATLKPAEHYDAIYYPGLRHKSRPRLSFKYEQKSFVDVPHVQTKKENTQHFFRVRKPKPRRKIFHISRQNDSLPQAEVDQVIGVPNTESKLRDYIKKKDTIEDKRYDYILDKLPEAWTVTQDTILPLFLEKNNDEVNISATGGQTTVLNQISLALPETKPLIQNKEKYGSDTESEIKNSQFEKTSKNITEGMGFSNAQAHDSTLDTTTPMSTTPWIEILIMPDGAIQWEINGTTENLPKLLVEEIIIEDSPTATSSESNMHILNENNIKAYTISSRPNSTKSFEVTEKTPTSSDITILPESSTESRIEASNRLLSYSSKALEGATTNINSRRKAPYNVQGSSSTTVNNEDLISPILPTRYRRRKHGRRKSTTSDDVVSTKITSTASTTTVLEPEFSKNSSSHNDFTYRLDHHFRRRNKVAMVSKPTENLTSGSEHIRNSTEAISRHTQIRGKPKYRKWNRNRNITPTVMNPHIISSNVTEDIGNLPSLVALPKTPVDVKDDTDNTGQRVDLSKIEGKGASTTTFKTNLARMRFRNRTRKVNTTTQEATSKSEIIESTERTTTKTKEDNENTTSKPSTKEKLKRPPPPPPPTLSPWSDGFGK